MSIQRFLSGSRDQAFLLPPDMREWLADDHLVWAVIEAVEQLDLNLLRGAYRDDGNGRPAYDPALLVALLLYGYATGDRSSRVIERRCREDVACRVIMAGLAPDHATIARFRRRHAQALIGLFSQVLALCRAAGLGRLGTIAIDGTKIHANASKERYAMREQAAALIDDAEAVDDLEDNLDRSGQAALKGSNGVGNAAECRARFDAAAKQLSSSEADAPAPAPAKLDPKSNQARGRRLATSRRGAQNLTDPESRVMRSRSGWIQGYNARSQSATTTS